MGRNYNDDNPIPDGRHWGTYSATTELPCASSGVREITLTPGDLAAAGGELYVCTAISGAGVATWSLVPRAAGAASLTDLTLSGGIVQATAPHGVANWQPIAATSGTDTAFADGTHFLTSLFIPVNKTLTGVGYLIGSVGGTDKVYAALYDADGALLANSSLTSGGATVGTAANVQTLAFTATYAAKGPKLYYVGVSANGATAKLRTVPAHTQSGIFAGSVAQTHGTVAAVVEPVTFTADKAPVCFVY